MGAREGGCATYLKERQRELEVRPEVLVDIDEGT